MVLKLVSVEITWYLNLRDGCFISSQRSNDMMAWFCCTCAAMSDGPDRAWELTCYTNLFYWLPSAIVARQQNKLPKSYGFVKMNAIIQGIDASVWVRPRWIQHSVNHLVVHVGDYSWEMSHQSPVGKIFHEADTSNTQLGLGKKNSWWRFGKHNGFG